MRSTKSKKYNLPKSALIAGLFLAAGSVFAASTTVNLTAQRMTVTMPDGNTVPMWGYCDAGNNTDATVLGGATLTAAASCTPAAGATAAAWLPGPTITIPYDAAGTSLTIHLTNNLPEKTSIVILGQYGGGLGQPQRDPSPAHAPQTVTWPAGDTATHFFPPAQADRARSFSPDVGVAGASGDYIWSKLKPGTYIYETGSHPSIQAPMGLYGVLVVTNAPNATTTPATAGIAYPASTTYPIHADISYDADATLLFSEIDPKQNTAVDQANGDTSLYPPAVNYAPVYFLVNGHSFDPADANSNVFPINAAAISKNMLIRFANAGLHSHVPATIGMPMSVVAEDGNVLPGKARVLSQLLLPAGKTHDVLVSPALDSTGTVYNGSIISVFDRELATSANKQSGGLQATLQVNGGTLPKALSCVVTNDNFTVKSNSPSFTANVLANDRGNTGATVVNPPTYGTVVMNSNGSFTYTPNSGVVTADSFMYVGNCGTAVGTVNLSVADAGNVTAGNDEYTSKVATVLKVNAPGVLANDIETSAKSYKLSAVLDDASVPTGLTVLMQPDGSFSASTAIPGDYTFTYHAQNAQGVATQASVLLHFVAGSGLQVAVIDTTDKTTIPDNDYSWVIEEDNTWYADPTNPSGTGTATGVTTPPQSVSTNFHKSYMPVVATGCTGPRSCGYATPFPSLPADVVLDPTKRYYISVLPADAMDGDPDSIGTATPVYGHSMGGATIQPGSKAVTVLAPRNPLPGGQISVIVFEDSVTNGGVDDGEPGLGGFTINLFDTRGSTGDIAGQVTYDLAGQPLTNALANTIDSVTKVNLCPLPSPMGVVTTCPELDSNGDPTVLAGMALIKNVEPGRYDVLAIPGIERHNKGEEWVQVSTLEGTLVNDTFVKPGEPGYWQEFGSPGFHSFIGFINPAHVKQKHADAVAADPKADWGYTVSGNISSLHMDRPPAANLNDSCATAGTVDDTCRASLNYTQCQVGIDLNGDGNNISYAMCDPQGNFSLAGIPPGNHKLVIWDQWLDQIIAYKAVQVPAPVNPNIPPPADPHKIELGSIPVFSWFTRIEQTAFMDKNGNGIQDADEPGIPMIPLNVRFRDGSVSNYLATDLAGNGGTNELFPLFNWYVLETDTTRYKGTKTHIVYDAGGKPDVAGPYAGVLNSTETTPLPDALKYPGSTYTPGKTERIDPGSVLSEGIQGFINQTAVVEWGKQPYADGENGGITGMVYYASTRALDDPMLTTQLSWEPGVADVTINLYEETINADGTQSLKLIDHTVSSSWDKNVNNMHCPNNAATDPFVTTTLGLDNQFKCYDGQHVFNQIQPAVYDGRYRFPSTNCTHCTTNPADGTSMLYKGKYVVEVVLPNGYEIVKEEDNNIFYGDTWMNPDTATQFAGVGNVFILKDQATLNTPIAMGAGAAFPPCVGRDHVVPDYLSQFPEQQVFSPYAGQTRPLCDRKEVVLDDQSQGGADFPIFTNTMVAAHFTGIMLNDAAAEFDPYSPSFGEKAALPNAPIAVRDYNGVEIARVYNDKYGSFNGMIASTFDANVPNPSGYAPNMLTWCMNDPGPIPDPNGSGKMIIDPAYNPMFSNFCYAWPAMPGQTSYLDTPVLPTAAFANASGYAPVDCQYPVATPAISRVDSSNGVGPWVLTGGTSTITIQAQGDVDVLNPAYGGPTALDYPANQPKIKRHFGFGGTQGTVTVGGTALTVTSWTDLSITATVPAGVKTGQLVITAANGTKSIDAVTLHVVATAPMVVTPVAGDGMAHPIQTAIDNAKNGDLIILEAGYYPELVVMDKPVQLQGVGAASVVIDATKYPNQKLRAWRTRINSDFGLDDQGNQAVAPADAKVDPLIGQTVTGGILQLEPTVLASEEGAGITVLAKGLRADGVTPVTSNDCNASSANYQPNSFYCAASMIDGVSVTGGDAGGGIYVNGWAHNLEISNNRVFGNAGPFNGGVRIGQPYLEGQSLPVDANGAPTTNTNISNFGLGYDVNVNIHNNNISTNGMVEGAPAAGTAANANGAGGGLSIAAGSDNYKVTSNWICGNFSSADGGGIGHIGLSNNGLIKNNFVIFNESYNQTGSQHGGGIAIEADNPGGIGSGNVTVDSNLIVGNFARAGHGGGIRLQNVNGEDVTYSFGGGNTPRGWRVTVINNMINNNVSGWAGGGISLADTINSVLINNTIASNDSMGMTGNLLTTVPGSAVTGVPNPAGVSSESTSTALLGFYTAGQQTSRQISQPAVFQNNIIWQNRSFFFDVRADATGVKKAVVIASNNWADAFAHTGSSLGASNANWDCVAGAQYWDVGVVGDTTTTPNANTNLSLHPTYAVMTSSAGYTNAANNNRIYTANPNLVKQYCNGSRVLPGAQFEPGTPFQPAFTEQAAATLDESGNFVDLHFGPLSLTNPGTPTSAVYVGDAHLLNTSSSAYNVGSNSNGAPNYDYDGDPRLVRTGNATTARNYEIGADELPAVKLTPSPLAFPDTLVGATSTLTATFSNISTANVTLNTTGAVAVSGNQFGLVTAGTTCTNGLLLAPGASCVIITRFAPTAAGSTNNTGTLTVNSSEGALATTMTGTRLAAVVSFTSPNPLAFGNVSVATTHTETVTNTGNAPMTITNVAITGSATSTSHYAITANTCTGATVIPGATCTVDVRFTPAANNTNYTANLVFTDTALASPQSVAMSGR